MKDIPGFEELYAVTEDGRIWSYPKDGSGGHSGRFLYLSKNRYGYVFVTLESRGRKKLIYIHREVAKAFIANKTGLAEVNHKDGDKQNNSVENLEWCTRTENLQHAYKIGLRSARGESNARSKVSEADVRRIRRLYSEGMTQKTICAMYPVNDRSISNICLRKTWQHVSGLDQSA